MRTTTLAPEEARAAHTQAGRKIEYLSIAWTMLEAAAGIIAGVLAAASLLLASVLILPSKSHQASSCSGVSVIIPHAEERENVAHRLVGVGFLVLAVYISFDALHDLITYELPRVSYFGIVYAAACIVVMPLLARAKRRVAAQLDSDALHADSHQSDICAYLSVILLVGLGLNALFGWWWADPVAALCMLPIIIKEGFAGLRGESCSYHH